MAANLNHFRFRSQSIPISFLSPFPFIHVRCRSSSSPLNVSALISTPPISNTLKTLTLDSPHSSHGPSLHKGANPNLSQQHQDNSLIDRDSFSKTFLIAALRVSADHCFALESRLRGHLLNWPRVRNIARVPGDDIDPDFKNILPLQNVADEEAAIESVNRRIYGKANDDGEQLSPVLYREKLTKTFNCRGFLKFRYLAKISRPKKKKKKEEEERGVEEVVKRVGKNDFVAVEVVGDDDDEDLSGLLGDEFKGKRWRGSTRLLLLDERYASRGVDELPEAVKVDLF